MFELALGCVKTLNVRLVFVYLKNKSYGKHCWENTIKKMILRAPRAQTFLHSLGQKLPRHHSIAASVTRPITAAPVVGGRIHERRIPTRVASADLFIEVLRGY